MASINCRILAHLCRAGRILTPRKSLSCYSIVSLKLELPKTKHLLVKSFSVDHEHWAIAVNAQNEDHHDAGDSSQNSNLENDDVKDERLDEATGTTKKRSKCSRSKSTKKIRSRMNHNQDNSNHSTIIEARNILKEIEESLKDTASEGESDKLVEVELQISKIASNPSHLLGLSVNELRRRYKILTTYQFPPILALRIALNVPTLLTLELPSVERVIKVFQKYDLGLYRFLSDPHLFALDPTIVEGNIIRMTQLGLSSKQISDIVFRHPVSIALPLSEESLSTLRPYCSEEDEKASLFISNIIKKGLTSVSVQHEKNQVFEDGVAFLNKVGVSVNTMLGKYSEFFSYKSDHLWECFDFLCGKPLFFDVGAIREFIERNPDVFTMVNQKDTKDLIFKIHSIVDDGNRLFSLFTRKSKLFTKPELVSQKIATLKKWKFTDNQIRKLLVQYSSLFLAERDNLQERLRFLLNNNDITVEDVVKHGSLLTVRSSIMKWRIGFLREKNLGALKQYDPIDVVQSDEETFAVRICNSTYAEFDAHIQENLHFERNNDFLDKREIKKGLR